MSQSTFLIIDTSAEICSVAIQIDGTIKYTDENHLPNSHATSLTQLIENCMSKASLKFSDLNAICINEGPGSYTGLRIGISVAKGISFAHDIPIFGIDGLNANGKAYLESRNHTCDTVLIAIDARRDEIYGTILDKNAQTIIKTKPIIINSEFLESLNHFKQIDIISNCPDKMEKLMNLKNGKIIRDWKFVASHMNIACCEISLNMNNINLISFEPNYLKNSYIKQE